VTRREHLLKARDELHGIVADAYVAGAHGVVLAQKMRNDFAKIDRILRDLERRTEAPVNGAITTEPVK